MGEKIFGNYKTKRDGRFYEVYELEVDGWHYLDCFYTEREATNAAVLLESGRFSLKEIKNNIKDLASGTGYFDTWSEAGFRESWNEYNKENPEDIFDIEAAINGEVGGYFTVNTADGLYIVEWVG